MEKFIHRPDGRAVDSICTQCFRTVGTRRVESDLQHDERVHVCSDRDLERIGGWNKRPFRVK